MLNESFGPSGQWPDQDLIAFSSEFDASRVLLAYHCGVFPMPLDVGGHENEMGWWSPVKRGILPLSNFRITKSMRSSARDYITTVDQVCDEVIEHCANPNRPGGWINDQIKTVYLQLHSLSIVHSIETWDTQGRLVGGLYGLSVGGLFAGESMFHDPRFGRDASKVALMRLVYELRQQQVLLDVQWVTSHLSSLGAIEIPRQQYLKTLSLALDKENHSWPLSQESAMTGKFLVNQLTAK